MHKNVVAQIRKATRRKYSAEEKIRIVLQGLRGEIPISELCRREGSPRRCMTGVPRRLWRRGRTD